MITASTPNFRTDVHHHKSKSAKSRKATAPKKDAAPAPVPAWTVPSGFALDKQIPETLSHWHRKAMRAVAQLPATASDAEITAAMKQVNEIFAAIIAKTEPRARAVSVQMNATVERLAFFGKGTPIEEVLSADDFMRLAVALASAVAPIEPKKAVGKLSIGKRLTRAGLLHRYQSFLINELMTLSWNLYGDRDYALRIAIEDDAVNKRCRGRSYPFFDESKLSTRARSVLKSLAINTTDKNERD